MAPPLVPSPAPFACQAQAGEMLGTAAEKGGWGRGGERINGGCSHPLGSGTLGASGAGGSSKPPCSSPCPGTGSAATASPGQRCLCPRARQTWIPPTFFRAKQPESALPGGEALPKPSTSLKTCKRRSSRPSRKLRGGLTGIQPRISCLQPAANPGTALPGTPGCGGLLPHRRLLSPSLRAAVSPRPDPSPGIAAQRHRTTERRQPPRSPLALFSPGGLLGWGGEGKAGGKGGGGEQCPPVLPFPNLLWIC